VPGLAPLEESCCGPRPPQVPEPDVGCPEAAVLYVGRNPPGSATIGRLENCDLLRLVPLGQGGYRTTLHLEALCLVPTGIQFHVRLESAAGVLMEESASIDFVTRTDGFVQRLGLNFIVEVPSPEGKPALLTVTAADTEGLTLERKVRVTLTLGAVPPLP
jgi:hypothetical protein